MQRGAGAGKRIRLLIAGRKVDMADRVLAEGADCRGRVKRFRELIGKARLDGVLLTDLRSVRYLSGFTGSSAYAVITPSRALFFTDSRYETQSASEVEGFDIRIFKKPLEEVSSSIKRLKVKALGFEEGAMTVDLHSRVKKLLPGVRLKPAGTIIKGLRTRKDAFEIERVRASAAILDSGFEHIAGLLKPGVIEAEAALSVEVFFRKKGAEGIAFDTIVASGERAALPHGKASDKAIRKGDLVIVDMGALKNGYNSDETRTFSIGRPSSEQKKIYGIVSDAQMYAIEAIRAGVSAAKVDAAARGHIKKSGYGEFFGHGTGHGVGLEIHEGPSLSPLSKGVLEEGMIITIEPGIYIPRWGGVRIEDMALVKKDGCELITASPKGLALS